MVRRRTKTTPVLHKTPPPTDARPLDSRFRSAPWTLVGFVVGLAAYWGWFYQHEIVPDVRGYERLAFVLLPDRLVFDWCGGRWGQVEIVDRVGPFSVVTLLWCVAGLFGWLVLDVLRVGRRLDCSEACALAIGLGLNGISLFALLVGLLGGASQPHWFLLLGAFLLVAVIVRVKRTGTPRSVCRRAEFVMDRDRAEVADDRPRTRDLSVAASNAVDDTACRRHPWWRPRWWWAALPFLWVLLAGAVLPPLDFDVLEYHLQVPKEWYLQGQITFLPHNVYGNMPLGSEMLAMQSMALMRGELAWWWGALAGKLAMASYTLLTTILLFAAGRRLYSRRAGIIAALLYISTAWVMRVAMNGLNEGPVAFYLFASFYVGYLWWRECRSGERPPWGLLLLAGLLAGGAVSCKYTSLLFVVLPLLVVVTLGSGAVRFRAMAVFVLAVALACGLWFGKNLVLTGNPTYPLLVDLFDGATRTPEKDAQWRRAHRVPRDVHGRRYSLSQIGDAAVDLLGRDCWQNPLVVPLMVLVALCWRRRQAVFYWFAMLAVVFFAWWLTTHRLERFLVPVLPIMALLAGIGATCLDDNMWRRAIAAIVGIGLFANFIFIVAPAPSIADNRLLVSLVQLRDDPRMDVTSGACQSIAFRYLNDHVPVGFRALVVGDAAVFNLHVPVLYNTCFDDCVFEKIFRDRTKLERREYLRQSKISHIYIDWSEIARYRQPGNYGYSSYITRALVHKELVLQQALLRPVQVPGLDSVYAEMFEVVAESSAGSRRELRTRVEGRRVDLPLSNGPSRVETK